MGRTGSLAASSSAPVRGSTVLPASTVTSTTVTIPTMAIRAHFPDVALNSSTTSRAMKPATVMATPFPKTILQAMNMLCLASTAAVAELAVVAADTAVVAHLSN